MQKSPRQAYSLLVLLGTGVLTPVASDAAEWRVTPSLTLRETYTDNVRLAPRGQEQSDWITEIEPGVAIFRRGPRLQVDASYTFAYRLYANSPESSGHNHSLLSNALLDVWDRNLFLQASASIYQQNISALGAQPATNATLSGNRTEVQTYTLSPYWTSRLGSWANLLARYTWNRTQSDDPFNSAGSESQRINLGLSSGPVFRDLGWNLLYSKERIEATNSQFDERELESYSLGVRYQLYPTFALTGSVGYEDNSYGSVRGSTSGSTWSAGFDWTPSLRTRLAASFGEQIFGNTYSVDFSHRTRVTTWTLRYSEQIYATPGTFSTPTNASTAVTLDRLFQAQIPDPVERAQAVQAFIRQSGLPTTMQTSVDFLTNQVTLSKLLTGGFGYRGVRTSFFLNVFRDDRRDESTGLSTIGTDPFANSNRVIQTGFSAFLSYRLSELTSATVGTGYSVSRLTDIDQEETNEFYRVGVTHQFQPKVRGAVDVRRTKSDPNTGASTVENAIVGTLSITF